MSLIPVVDGRKKFISEVSKHKKIIVFYHRADYDGKASGAIIGIELFKLRCNFELIGYDYGDNLHQILSDIENNPRPKNDFTPVDDIDFDDIGSGNNGTTLLLFVDCNPQDLKSEDYRVLISNKYRFGVIDHHESFIKDKAPLINSYYDFSWGGNSSPTTGSAACYHAWTFVTNREVPLIIQLLEEHDRWVRTGDGIHNQYNRYCIQSGLRGVYESRLTPRTPKDSKSKEWISLWLELFKLTEETIQNHLMFTVGKIVWDAEVYNNAGICKKCAQEIVFERKRFICVNHPSGNSTLFDSVYNPDIHDGMLKWCQSKEGKILITMYTTHGSINDIAVKHGGGGHPQACGFTCEKIDFMRIKDPLPGELDLPILYIAK